jgi:hypothetical protein
MGVGLAEIGQAAGAVASVVAGSLGADGVLSRLYALCRDFVKKVFDSVVALIGDQLAKVIGDRIIEWVKDVKDHQLFGAWLAKAYGVESIKADLRVAIDKSQEEPSRFSPAEGEVDKLTDRFNGDMKLTDKLIGGLGWLKWVPGASGPQGLLIQGGAYLLLLALGRARRRRLPGFSAYRSSHPRAGCPRGGGRKDLADAVMTGARVQSARSNVRIARVATRRACGPITDIGGVYGVSAISRFHPRRGRR